MRTKFWGLILFGAAMVLSGCVERHYSPYYHGGSGYYGDHHDRWHEQGRHRDDDHR